MSDVIQQEARPLFKALVTDAVTSSFTAKTAAVMARPSGNLVLELASQSGQVIPGAMRLFPIGIGSDEDAYSMRVWGWHRLKTFGAAVAGPDQWIPAILGEFTCTLGTFAGVTGSTTGQAGSSYLFADTMTIVALDGEATLTADVTRIGTTELFTPANNTPAWVRMRTHGAELLEFDFDQTTNTPSMNVLVQFLAENY